MKITKANLLTILPALVSLTGGANAVMIEWAPAQGITSNLDIQNPGSIHTALNLTNTDSGTMNVDVGGINVPFSNVTALPFRAAGSGFYTAGGVSADFESVLDSFNWNQGNSSTIPFTGLTPGGTYLLQAFASDGRNNNNWGLDLDVGGNTTVLSSGSGSPAVGSNGQEFVNGLITLGQGETSFNLNTSSSSGFVPGVLNAVVLSAHTPATMSAIPEPSSSLALAGLLALGIFGRRRH